MLKHYFKLTKPGIIVGNLMTLSGGFCLASHGTLNVSLLLATLIGMALVIASACVLNNIIDRDIDKLMQRTRHRLTATDVASLKTLVIYASILGLLGMVILSLATNLLTVSLAIFGLLIYVILYSLWLKRTSLYGTLVGGVAGAIPPVVGYCAVTDQLTIVAIALFLILLCWQIPHSYAIAIFRLKDYTAANIPVLPVKKGVPYTKVSILVYIIAFTIVAVMPGVLGYTGWLYIIIASVLGIVWIMLGIQGLSTHNDTIWARKMFLVSIINIILLSLLWAV